MIPFISITLHNNPSIVQMTLHVGYHRTLEEFPDTSYHTLWQRQTVKTRSRLWDNIGVTYWFHMPALLLCIYKQLRITNRVSHHSLSARPQLERWVQPVY